MFLIIDAEPPDTRGSAVVLSGWDYAQRRVPSKRKPGVERAHLATHQGGTGLLWRWARGLHGRALKSYVSNREGPSTQYLSFLAPNTIKGMVVGTRIFKSWVLGSSGQVYASESVLPCENFRSHGP